MKPSRFILQSILVSGALIACQGYAQTSIINPSADAFVTNGTLNGADPSENYGGTGALMVAGAASGNGTFETLMRFDLSTTKALFDFQYGAGNWMISEITLTLAGNNAVQGMQPNNPIFPKINLGGFSIAWLANDSWIEGTGSPSSPTTNGVTFNSLSSLTGASDETLGSYFYSPPGNNVQLTWDLSLTPGFLADASSGSDLTLLFAPSDSSVSYLFNSRSYGTSAARPQLNVTALAIPEPSSALLLFAGIGALAIGRSVTGRN